MRNPFFFCTCRQLSLKKKKAEAAGRLPPVFATLDKCVKLSLVQSAMCADLDYLTVKHIFNMFLVRKLIMFLLK